MSTALIGALKAEILMLRELARDCIPWIYGIDDIKAEDMAAYNDLLKRLREAAAMLEKREVKYGIRPGVEKTV
jgi:hypothetical protein